MQVERNLIYYCFSRSLKFNIAKKMKLQKYFGRGLLKELNGRQGEKNGAVGGLDGGRMPAAVGVGARDRHPL